MLIWRRALPTLLQIIRFTRWKDADELRQQVCYEHTMVDKLKNFSGYCGVAEPLGQQVSGVEEVGEVGVLGFRC